MINIRRALYELNLHNNESHSKISREANINKKSCDELVNKEKITYEFKITKTKNEFKGANDKIIVNKTNKQREYIKETKNEFKENKEQSDVKIKNVINSTKINQKYAKDDIFGTLIKFIKIIIIFKLFYILLKLNVNNIFRKYFIGNIFINNQIDNENSINSSNFNNFESDIIINIVLLIILLIIKFSLINPYKNRETRNFYFLSYRLQRNDFIYDKIDFSELKKELTKTGESKEIKKIKNNKKYINENKQRKSMNKINDYSPNKYIIITLIKVLMMDLIYNIKCDKFDLIYSQYSNITLKIKGIGYKRILGYHYSTPLPNEVYINGSKQERVKNTYNFTQTDNLVKLIFQNNLINCSYMFQGCSNITEINLSCFNSSQVTSMNGMFYRCSSLISLNLTNFNTSKVTDMGYMFYGCSNLTTLNLSNFDTSNVTDMRYMFSGCSNLTSLNLSNFDTSNVTDMRYMFSNCKKLEYINLKNFDGNKLKNDYYKNMFLAIPENVVICIDQNISNLNIVNQIQKKLCYIIYCSDDWISKQKMIKEGKCIEYC